MIKEIAVEPEVMATWSHFREIWDDCGVSRGRLICEYPSQWCDLVIKKARESSSTKASSIESKLKPGPGNPKSNKLIKTNRNYDPGKDWLNNAEKHEPPNAFDAVIARKKPRDNNRVLVAGEFDKGQSPWKTETGLEITRSTADLVKCARLLLNVSSELVLVDPNFDAYEPRFRDPFAALAQIRPDAKPWKRFELHVEHPHTKGRPDVQILQNRVHYMKQYMPPLVPTGTKLKVFFWQGKAAGKRLHPRFILTELGGLQPDYGLDEGQNEQDKTIISLLSETVWQSTWADYCETSQTFTLGKDCLVEIAGTG